METENNTQRSIELQKAISARLAELAYADSNRAERISRHLAVAVGSAKALSENTLPLFLNLPRESESSIAQVALTIKVQLEELTDTLIDLRRELPEWSEFFVALSQR